MKRRIVEINEELCNGCGACANACHEGAIAMINGKARLIKDDYCDGLGDCLPACPTGAIEIIEREAAAYDEVAVKARMEKRKAALAENGGETEFHGCPGSMARSLQQPVEKMSVNNHQDDVQESRLMQWPVQIKLVPVKAPYFEHANLLIAADCTAYAYAGFHEKFMKNHVTLIGCPKLDAGDYSEKLCEIIKNNEIKSIKILRMEVPCCGGIEQAAVTAMKNSGKMLPWQVVTISIDGKILEA